MNSNIDDIVIAGNQEHTDMLNAQLLTDVNTYRTRPFLNGQERTNLGEYYCTWGINKLIALFNFDKNGNYLPNAYNAPTEYLKMLYPIDDIINYNRTGTLVVDREQYSPELRKLSYFIYIVDEQLYEDYRKAQHFHGISAPTYMFNQKANDGVRVFKDYFALARHLRKQKFITYILGPRTAFYLRYFLYQIHVHTISAEYAFGDVQNASIVNNVISAINRHLAFNKKEQLDYKVDITVDDYKDYRALQQSMIFKMNLPDKQEFHNKTDIVRYSKQSLNLQVMRLKKNKLEKYKCMALAEYHHVIVTNDYVIFYVWDTRKIEAIIPVQNFELDDLARNEHDNGTDLVCAANASSDVRSICEKLRFELAIQMRD